MTAGAQSGTEARHRWHRDTRRGAASYAALIATLMSRAIVGASVDAGDKTPRSLAEIEAELKVVDRAIEDSAQSAKPLSRNAKEPEVTGSWWSTTDAMTISSVVLVFGVTVLILAYGVIQKGAQPDAVLRIFGTILIIVSAVFLVVAGYSDKQIAPVMGLLGTIVGYLLGKDVPKPAPRGDENPQ